MRVVCPTCEAAYEVPAAVVQAGRTLRCTGCGLQFPASGSGPPAHAARHAPAPDAPPPQPAVEAEPPAQSRPGSPDIRLNEAARLPTSGEPAATVVRTRAKAAVLAAWVLSLVLLGTGAGAALTWRRQIMTAWPPSTRAYAALGYR